MKRFVIQLNHRRFFSSIFLIGLILLAFQHPVTADESQASQPAAEIVSMDDIVVTATRSERSAAEIYADVEVISSEEIADSSSNDLLDLLRGIPGMDNRGQTGQGGWFSTDIRGIDSSRGMLMMVDGVPLNSGLSDFTYTSGIDLSIIDQIEVVKGNFSSLYGSNAMGGVINVITKKRETDGFDITGRMDAGDFGFYEYGSNVIGRKGRLTYSINASQQHFDNRYRRDQQLEYERSGMMGNYTYTKVYTDIEDADSDNSRVFARIDYDVDDTTGFTLSGNYATSSENLGKSENLPTVRDLGDKEQDTYFLNLNAHTTLLDDLDLDLQLYTNYDERDTNKEQRVSSGMMGSSYEMGHQNFWGRNNGLQIKANKSIFARHYITSGIDANYKQGYWKETYEDGEVIDTTLDKTMTNYAVYLQDEIDLAPVTITLGGRYDANSESEDAFSPKLGLFYKMSDRISFHGSAGKAFRAPTLQEMYQPTWLMGMYLFYSNPDLEPETVWSYDLGTTIKITPKIDFFVTGFYSKAEDLISTSPTIIDGQTVRIYENLEEVETDGFEAGIEGWLTPWLTFNLNYTYTHSVEKGEGRLADVPLHQANLSLGTRTPIGKHLVLNTTLNARYSGETTYVDSMTDMTVEKLDGFTVMDFIVRLNILEKHSLKFAMYNILDEEYQVHGSNLGPERYFWAGAEFTF
ncbi:TonB-dependent receptor plug domain-containing protein [Desulfosarcina ovata]|uniref:TonB-dependent receptor n=1 Tax=Desulfosarcina ovata subsp. ovata TaxID=2752305 RepID=A0A5K8AAC0_9BACT|nr:TonB-dependent receptor [Desulfosarcina ovata]BBO89653.1 TonB-dependent receptor [Desulfosarcina ovata subsp. ovata]